MKASIQQIDIMRHALGVCGRRSAFRNHFVTGPGSTNYDHCEALVAAGLMRRYAGTELSGGDPIFVVTDAGRAAAGC